MLLGSAHAVELLNEADAVAVEEEMRVDPVEVLVFALGDEAFSEHLVHGALKGGAADLDVVGFGVVLDFEPR